LPGLTSGNLQSVIYDLTSLEIYVAYGYMTDDKSFKLNAYERPYLYFDMNKVFAEPKPQLKLIEEDYDVNEIFEWSFLIKNIKTIKKSYI